MPSKPCVSSQPTFYLDTSTISKAFSAHQVGRDGEPYREHAPLFPWIEHVARTANLVVSHVHIAELADWDDARGLIQWLDTLPLVWARFWQHVQDDEDEYWLLHAVGDRSQPVRVFAPSMLCAFEEAGVAQTPALLGLPTLVAQWERERKNGSLRTLMRLLAQQMAQAFNEDRRVAKSRGVDEARIEKRLDLNSRTHLRVRARDAFERLKRRGAAPPSTAGLVQDPFVTQYKALPTSMPLQRVSDRLTRALAEVASKRSPGSRKFGQLDSSMADLFHAFTGAAYCDVFTCDKLTSQWLGDVRVQLGFKPQLAEGEVGGGTRGFVEALMATMA